MTTTSGSAARIITIVAAIPSVAHTEVLVTSRIARTIVIPTSLIIAVAVVHPPAVASTIGNIEAGTTEVEVVTMRVAGIDTEVPIAGFPEQGTVEVGSCAEQIPLPREQNIAQIQVAALPIRAEHIVLAGDSHEVIEVYLVGSLILSIAQIQLVSHLVGEEEGLFTCLLIGHGICACCYRQHGKQGKHHLLHSRIVFNSSTMRFFVSLVQSNCFFLTPAKDFP